MDPSNRTHQQSLDLIADLRSQLAAKEQECQHLYRELTLFKSQERFESERLKWEMLQAKLANAIEMAHLGPWEYDVATDLFIFNDQFYKIFRTTAEQVGGYTMKSGEYTRRFLHPDEIHLVADETRKAIETTDPHYTRRLDHRILYADGQMGYISVRIFIQKDTTGRTIKTFGVNQDITHQKNIEAALRQRTAELEARNREFRQMAHKTIAAMENDRRNLSKELHDSVGGTLAAVMYQLEFLKEQKDTQPASLDDCLGKAISHLGKAIRESRLITKQMRPSVLDDFGLGAAVADHISDFMQFHPNIKIHTDIDISQSDLSSDGRTVLYRVLQEALNNVAKHSEADTVQVQLKRRHDRIQLTVRDNGVGFNPNHFFGPARAAATYGLHSMKERVEICNGEFRIKSAPGEGTEIMASMPLELIP